MEKEHEIALYILLGCVLFVFFGLVIAVQAYNSKRKKIDNELKLHFLEKQKRIELLAETAKTEEQQKIKIAEQLHDEILPIINNATTRISGAIIDLEKRGVEINNLKEEIKVFALLNESIREIIHDIVPKLFTSFGLLKAIEVYIKDRNKGQISIAEFSNNTDFKGELPFSVDEQLLIYKVFRELFNNLQKHSNYEYLLVTLEVEKWSILDNEYKKIILLFSHDGMKVSNEQINEFKNSTLGLGLKLLESRAFWLGASIDYTFDSEASYVRLQIPITIK